MYKALGKILSTYWKEYGGFSELLSSPIFHASVFATFLFALGLVEFDWRAFAIDALPTILGLSLAAYAITFSLMGSALHRALSLAVDRRQGIPLINVVNSTFFHVLLFQLAALIFAALSGGTGFNKLIALIPLEAEASKSVRELGFLVSQFLGFFLTSYSTMLLLSVGLAMFRLGRLNPTQARLEDERPDPGAANDDGSAIPAKIDLTKSWRFKLVAKLAKLLGLYESK